MKSLVFLLLTGFAIGATPTHSAGPLTVSDKAKNLIVSYETGGKSYYEKALARPTRPPGDSGVTIGIGYDLGYNTKAQIISDWSDLPEGTRTALASAAGYKGEAAYYRAKALKWILIPWTTAEKVFVNRTMPRFGKITFDAFPGVNNTNPHIQGAMLSLVFNRGSSMVGSSRSEMRAIRECIKSGDLLRIPTQIRSMKRIWEGRGMNGLLRRREDEAILCETPYIP